MGMVYRGCGVVDDVAEGVGDHFEKVMKVEYPSHRVVDYNHV